MVVPFSEIADLLRVISNKVFVKNNPLGNSEVDHSKL